MDMKTAVVLWKQISDQQQFIRQVSDTYKNDPDPQDEMVRKMFRDQGLDPDVEIEKLKASSDST